MKMIPLFCLVAVFAAPMHAQVCSGGASGGIDATGNQCADAAAIELPANGSNLASPASTGTMSRIPPSAAAHAGKHPTATLSYTPATLAVTGQGEPRFAEAVPPPSSPAKASKIESADASPCAGGPGRGMDATANQCAD